MARILIAEDEAAVREFVRRALTHRGHEVTLVEDGLEALGVLRDNDFDLLLTDKAGYQSAGQSWRDAEAGILAGRIADRTVICALGWRNGDRLTLTADSGVVVARRDPGGMITVPARPYIASPAALRRPCGLRDRAEHTGRKHRRSDSHRLHHLAPREHNSPPSRRFIS